MVDHIKKKSRLIGVELLDVTHLFIYTIVSVVTNNVLVISEKIALHVRNFNKQGGLSDFAKSFQRISPTHFSK